MRVPAAGLPLSALLSQALTAFTIEFDNEAEHRIPHRTTEGREGSGVWLTSMAMYLNCMRFVDADGITVSRVEALARTRTNWHGMQRWGYVKVHPDPAGPHAKPRRADWLVTATKKGRVAQQIWSPLAGVIEERWRERFGADQVTRLREALWAIARQFPIALPDCMPILQYALFSKESKYEPADHGDYGAALDLATLLARVLLAFAIEFETTSDLSLAIAANLLRVLDGQGIRMRELPVRTGVSKESISMALGILVKKNCVTVEPDTEGRGQVVRLTSAGLAAQSSSAALIRAVEANWIARFGADAIGRLREPLEELAGDEPEQSPLFEGLTPYPDGWRAARPKPRTLPHFPMVLHRGGYPDGS